MNLNISAILLTLAMTANAGQIHAQRYTSQEAALEAIVTNNPTLKTLSRSITASGIAADGSSRLEGLEIEGEYMFAPSGSSDKWSAGISQSFDWPGSYKARKRAAKAQVQTARLEYDAARLDIIHQARLDMASGVYNNKRFKVMAELYKNLDSIAKSIEFGYMHGQLTILDVKKIRLEQFKLKNRMADCQSEIDNINSRLAELSATVGMEVDYDSYRPLALESLEHYIASVELSPEIALAKAQADASRLQATASRLSRNPRFTLGYRHSYEERNHFNGLAASIGLPSWGRDYDRDYALAIADISDKQGTERYAGICAYIQNEYKNATKLRSIMNDYQKVLLDNEYYDLWIMAYNGGQVNVITLIQELNYYLEASLEYLDTDYRYRQALINLNKYTL